MMKLLFSFIFLTALEAQALKLELIAHTEIPHRLNFNKTVLGGISALSFQSESNTLWLLSDDRGTHAEPRVYKMKMELKFKGEVVEKFLLTPEQVIFIKQSEKKNLRDVADLESMSMLPWGNFLLGSEGDGNKKPRQPPRLIEVKPNGDFVRTYPVPEHFLPNRSGQQTKGVRNNLAFEAMTQIPDKNEWIVGVEAPLQQDRRSDKRSFVRWIQYLMPDAWVLKPAKQWLYQVETNQQILSFQNGLSEILAVNDKEILALERKLEVGDGVAFKVQLFLANLEKASDLANITSIAQSEISDSEGASLRPASKKLVLDFESLTSKIGKIENFEGMAWGPKLANGKSTLLLVSDDNFMRDLRTQVLIFSVDN